MSLRTTISNRIGRCLSITKYYCSGRPIIVKILIIWVSSGNTQNSSYIWVSACVSVGLTLNPEGKSFSMNWLALFLIGSQQGSRETSWTKWTNRLGSPTLALVLWFSRSFLCSLALDWPDQRAPFNPLTTSVGSRTRSKMDYFWAIGLWTWSVVLFSASAFHREAQLVLVYLAHSFIAPN